MSEIYGDKLGLLTERLALANTATAAELAYRDSVIEKQASEIKSLNLTIEGLEFEVASLEFEFDCH